MSNQPTTISASRVGALLGQSKWQTRLALFYELTGQAPPKPDNPLLEEGRLFEDVIAMSAAKELGFIILSNAPRHIESGNLSGHPDRIVLTPQNKVAVMEIKHTLFADGESEDQGWGPAGSDAVPPDYLLQCQVYGHLLPKVPRETIDAALEPVRKYIPTLGGHWQFDDTVYLVARLRYGRRHFKIKVDEQLIAHIDLEASAMLDRVARNEPPEPQEPSEFRSRWLPEPEKSAELSAEMLAVAREIKNRSKALKAEEEAIENLKMLLFGFARDASVLTYEGRKIGSVGADRKFDADAFAIAHPDVAAKCMVLSASKVPSSMKEAFMVRAESAADAKRVLRLSDKALEEIQ